MNEMEGVVSGREVKAMNDGERLISEGVTRV
jgi:hypothetical protein